MDQNNSNSTKKNVIYFKVISLLMPLVFIILIELMLRAFSVGDNVKLFISHPNKKYKEYYSVNPLIGKKYFNKFEPTKGTNDIFLKQKLENCFRVFVLGSSTLVGFPYEKNLMATRILHKRLQDAYPDKEIEVVNTAITAINSITFNDYMNEVVDYEPDAILFYAGHNEFYGAFGIGSHETISKNELVRNMHFKMMNWRIYQAMRGLYTKISMAMLTDENAADSKGSLMKRIVANQDIAYGSDLYHAGINQYRNNITQVLAKAKENNIPVYLCNLASNVKGLSPLGDNEKANTLYNKAIEKLNAADTLGASELFYKAKDIDPVRFRASEEINTVIDSLADVFNCFYIPVKEEFIKASEAGIIGNDLMTEHVHPNIEGQFVLANAFYKSIVKSKLIADETSKYNLHTANYYRANWGYTKLDSLIGTYKVNQLKSYWPFVSLDNEVTFRDLHKTTDVVDSLAFSVLLTYMPDVEGMHEFLAKEYLSEKKYEMALDEYEALVCTNPYWSHYYNNAANCLLKLSDLNRAEEYLKKSLVYSNTYFANLMLAEIEMIKHNFNAATKSYQNAIELADDDEVALQLKEKLYYAYYYAGEKENILKLKNDLMENELSLPNEIPELNFSYSSYLPYNVEQSLNMAYAHIKNNNTDSALVILQHSLMVNDAPLTNKLIGDILYNNKDNRLLFYYDKAYAAYRYSPSFLNSYCIANYVNKNTDKAKAILAEIKLLNANYKGIAGLEKLLK